MKTFSLIILLLLLSLDGGFAFAGNKQQCAELINTHCLGCHYKSRICQTLGKKRKWEWKSTVNYMIRLGVKLSEAEKKTIIDCLSSAPPGADFVCKNSPQRLRNKK